MTIRFYTYTGRMDAVSKNLPTPTELTGNQVTGMQEVTDPVINIASASIPTYNYAYIAEFGRYYFLDPPVWIGNNLFQYQFHVDVLYTYSSHILSQSGIVRYSALGRQDMYDPRIAFESVPSVGISTLGVTDNIMYVLRYWSMGGFSNRMSAVFMTATVFGYFYEVYNALSEADRVIAGSSIIDVTEIHYMNMTGIQALNQRSIITFRNAASSGSVAIDLTDAAGAPGDTVGYFIDSVSDVTKLSYTDIQTPATWTDGFFWSGSSNWRLMLPYAGAVELRPSDTGFYQITYSALRVAYEPFENAYVITPYINDRAFTQAQQVIPVLTSFAFPIDTSFDNISGNRIASILSSATGFVGGAAALAGGNPMGLLSMASTVVGSINSLEALRVREGTAGIQFVGTTGGSPAYTATLDGTKIYWIRTTAVPRDGYASLWADFGKPDGAYRALSTLSGYAEVSDIHIPLKSGLTDLERRQIESLLSGGVVF